jgi:hypothetical protein
MGYALWGSFWYIRSASWGKSYGVHEAHLSWGRRYSVRSWITIVLPSLGRHVQCTAGMLGRALDEQVLCLPCRILSEPHLSNQACAVECYFLQIRMHPLLLFCCVEAHSCQLSLLLKLPCSVDEEKLPIHLLLMLYCCVPPCSPLACQPHKMHMYMPPWWFPSGGWWTLYTKPCTPMASCRAAPWTASQLSP